MKYIVLVPDGMADEPVEQLGGKTPLEVAETPFMDYIAAHGILAQAVTIPDGFSPASDVANLSILGYDPRRYYSGRAPLEAAYMGVDLGPEDIAFRCNLVTTADGKMVDYSAGHITTAEAVTLMGALNQAIGSERVRFYPGVSYRNLVVLRGMDCAGLQKVLCTPPHDIANQVYAPSLPQGEGASFLVDLMKRSESVLVGQDINKVRLDLKENPATMIWLWGQGRKPDIPKFQEKFGLTGAVISAVDLIKGIGRIIGFDVINVEGATGYYDTNYEGKAKAALEALKTKDFVFVHVEATDEAGHNGDLRMKIASIERFDKMVARPVVEYVQGREDARVMVLPDHATPVMKRRHTSDKVCVAMMGAGIAPNGFSRLSEPEAAKSPLLFEGHRLLEVLFQ